MVSLYNPLHEFRRYNTPRQELPQVIQCRGLSPLTGLMGDDIGFLYKTPCQFALKIVHRALDAPAAPIQHMCVNHGCFDIFMAQQLLDSSDIVAAFQKMCSERIPECAAGGPFG